MTPRGRRLLLAAVLPPAALVVVSLAPAATAQTTTCLDFATVAAADGVRSVVAAPGLAPTDGDASGPSAQAVVDSLGQSLGHAGAPYSAAAAGNAGAADVDATQVPVFAMSSYPASPEAGSSSPALTLEARSEVRSSVARAVAGGSVSEEGSAGRASAAAEASCGDDGAVAARADDVVEVANFAGVLGLGAVRSHAEAVIDADGELTLGSSMTVEGATVLGQPVSITDQGLVVGGSPVPLASENPLAEALAEAGISVRTVAAVEDPEDGEVLAPGLEVVVTREAEGTGRTTTTYTFGRAYARASSTPDATGSIGAPGDVDLPAAASTPGGSPGGSAPRSPVSPSAGGSPTGPAPAAPAAATPTAAVPTSLIANASIASVYPALVVGAAVVVSAGIVFRTLGVKL